MTLSCQHCSIGYIFFKVSHKLWQWQPSYVLLTFLSVTLSPYRHKFLIVYGQNQTKKEIQAHTKGATKVSKAAAELFGLKEESLILQAYDREFEDYADIENQDTVEGPAKIRVTVEEPVVFPVT